MKNQISHVVLETIDFNAIKEENIFKKEKVVITFRLNELAQKYKIEIDYENNDKQPKEIFDFLDVSDYKIKSKTNFEGSIADKNLKIKKIVLDFDPLLIDFFAQRFSNFTNLLIIPIPRIYINKIHPPIIPLANINEKFCIVISSDVFGRSK